LSRFRAWALVASIVTAGAALATTELLLRDGRVIAADDVRRDGDNYTVTLESGDTIVIPVALVERLSLGSGRSDEDEAEPEDEPSRYGPDGVRYSEPQTLAGKAPQLRQPEAQVLAGVRVDAPTTAEQLAVFGEPAKFQESIIDNTWHPTSDWDMDPERQNNFAPSRWAEDIVDHDWEPEPAFDNDADVLADSRSTFKKGVVDSTWTPTDAFARD
jgi:hypothetical protein